MNNPKVQLEVTDVICSLHGEPFREDWPKGYGLASVKLFEEFAQLADVHAYTGGKAEKLPAAVAEFGPLCCAVGRNIMKKVYLNSGIEQFGKCRVCGAVEKGAAIRVREEDEVRMIEHVCFNCVLDANAAQGGLILP